MGQVTHIAGTQPWSAWLKGWLPTGHGLDPRDSAQLGSLCWASAVAWELAWLPWVRPWASTTQPGCRETQLLSCRLECGTHIPAPGRQGASLAVSPWSGLLPLYTKDWR